MKLVDLKRIYESNNRDLNEEEIIKFNDAGLAYEYAKENSNADIIRLGQIVIDSKNPKFNFYYARDIVGCNIKEHERVVIESEDPYYCILFAAYIPDADIKSLEQIVLKSKDPYLNYYFAVLITKRELDLDIKPHEKIVLQSKDPEWNFQFTTIPGANILAHGNIIYKSGDSNWIDSFNNCFKSRYEEAKTMKKSIIPSRKSQ